jgi:hypothetical protein
VKEFESLGAFARHMLRVAGRGEEVTSDLTLEAAKIVQGAAKARMGEYQDGVAGWPAWANLAPATVEDRLRKGFTPDDPLVRSGELRESIEIAHTGHEAAVGSTDPVLLYQEVGTGPGTWGKSATAGIPPRPVLGPAGYLSKEKIGERTAIGIIAWIAGLSWKRPPRDLPAVTGPSRG